MAYFRVAYSATLQRGYVHMVWSLKSTQGLKEESLFPHCLPIALVLCQTGPAAPQSHLELWVLSSLSSGSFFPTTLRKPTFGFTIVTSRLRDSCGRCRHVAPFNAATRQQAAPAHFPFEFMLLSVRKPSLKHSVSPVSVFLWPLSVRKEAGKVTIW